MMTEYKHIGGDLVDELKNIRDEYIIKHGTTVIQIIEEILMTHMQNMPKSVWRICFADPSCTMGPPNLNIDKFERSRIREPSITLEVQDYVTKHFSKQKISCTWQYEQCRCSEHTKYTLLIVELDIDKKKWSCCIQ